MFIKEPDSYSALEEDGTEVGTTTGAEIGTRPAWKHINHLHVHGRGEGLVLYTVLLQTQRAGTMPSAPVFILNDIFWI